MVHSVSGETIKFPPFGTTPGQMGKRASHNLTYQLLKGLKAGEKMVTLPDATEGLELYVTPGGTKTFSFRYTLPDGTRRRLNLGRWPGKTIEAARSEARSYMNVVAGGGDPATVEKQKRHAQRTKPVKTLSDLIAALLDASKAAGVRDSTLAYWTWLHKKHIAPRLGDSRIEDIGAGVVRKALREIGVAAGNTTGNRAFGLLRRAFNFGIEEEHLAASPLARMKALFEEGSRARVLTDDELKAIWKCASGTKEKARKGAKARDGLSVSRSMAIAVQLCLVTVQRGGEVAGMRAAELDIAGKLWVLPRERTKANREHVVPLTDLAIELINEASALAALRLGRAPIGADPIFPTTRLGNAARDAQGTLLAAPKPVARMSLGRAMARLCEAAGVKDASAHDLRRTASTVMASERIGVLGEVVARILNHAPPGMGVTAVYNRHAYIAEKRSALTRWAALLSEILAEDERPSNVRQLRGGAVA